MSTGGKWSVWDAAPAALVLAAFPTSHVACWLFLPAALTTFLWYPRIAESAKILVPHVDHRAWFGAPIVCVLVRTWITGLPTSLHLCSFLFCLLGSLAALIGGIFWPQIGAAVRPYLIFTGPLHWNVGPSVLAPINAAVPFWMRLDCVEILPFHGSFVHIRAGVTVIDPAKWDPVKAAEQVVNGVTSQADMLYAALCPVAAPARHLFFIIPCVDVVLRFFPFWIFGELVLTPACLTVNPDAVSSLPGPTSPATTPIVKVRITIIIWGVYNITVRPIIVVNDGTPLITCPVKLTLASQYGLGAMFVLNKRGVLGANMTVTPTVHVEPHVASALQAILGRIVCAITWGTAQSLSSDADDLTSVDVQLALLLEQKPIDGANTAALELSDTLALAYKNMAERSPFDAMSKHCVIDAVNITVGIPSHTPTLVLSVTGITAHVGADKKISMSVKTCSMGRADQAATTTWCRTGTAESTHDTTENAIQVAMHNETASVALRHVVMFAVPKDMLTVLPTLTACTAAIYSDPHLPTIPGPTLTTPAATAASSTPIQDIPPTKGGMVPEGTFDVTMVALTVCIPGRTGMKQMLVMRFQELTLHAHNDGMEDDISMELMGFRIDADDDEVEDDLVTEQILTFDDSFTLTMGTNMLPLNINVPPISISVTSRLLHTMVQAANWILADLTPDDNDKGSESDGGDPQSKEDMFTKRMQQLFYSLDADNNGTLDRAEMLEFCERQCPLLSRRELLAAFENMWCMVDQDANGSCSFAEFLRVIPQLSTSKGNGSGELQWTLGELRNAHAEQIIASNERFWQAYVEATGTASLPPQDIRAMQYHLVRHLQSYDCATRAWRTFVVPALHGVVAPPGVRPVVDDFDTRAVTKRGGSFMGRRDSKLREPLYVPKMQTVMPVLNVPGRVLVKDIPFCQTHNTQEFTVHVELRARQMDKRQVAMSCLYKLGKKYYGWELGVEGGRLYFLFADGGGLGTASSKNMVQADHWFRVLISLKDKVKLFIDDAEEAAVDCTNFQPSLLQPLYFGKSDYHTATSLLSSATSGILSVKQTFSCELRSLSVFDVQRDDVAVFKPSDVTNAVGCCFAGQFTAISVDKGTSIFRLGNLELRWTPQNVLIAMFEGKEQFFSEPYVSLDLITVGVTMGPMCNLVLNDKEVWMHTARGEESRTWQLWLYNMFAHCRFAPAKHLQWQVQPSENLIGFAHFLKHAWELPTPPPAQAIIKAYIHQGGCKIMVLDDLSLKPNLQCEYKSMDAHVDLSEDSQEVSLQLTNFRATCKDEVLIEPWTVDVKGVKVEDWRVTVRALKHFILLPTPEIVSVLMPTFADLQCVAKRKECAMIPPFCHIAATDSVHISQVPRGRFWVFNRTGVDVCYWLVAEDRRFGPIRVQSGYLSPVGLSGDLQFHVQVESGDFGVVKNIMLRRGTAKYILPHPDNLYYLVVEIANGPYGLTLTLKSSLTIANESNSAIDVQIFDSQRAHICDPVTLEGNACWEVPLSCVLKIDYIRSSQGHEIRLTDNTTQCNSAALRQSRIVVPPPGNTGGYYIEQDVATCVRLVPFLSIVNAFPVPIDVAGNIVLPGEAWEKQVSANMKVRLPHPCGEVNFTWKGVSRRDWRKITISHSKTLWKKNKIQQILFFPSTVVNNRTGFVLEVQTKKSDARSNNVAQCDDELLAIEDADVLTMRATERKGTPPGDWSHHTSDITNSKWTDTSVGAGSTGATTLNVSNIVAVHSAPLTGTFFRSKLVTIAPRFIVVNRLPFPVIIRASNILPLNMHYPPEGESGFSLGLGASSALYEFVGDGEACVAIQAVVDRAAAKLVEGNYAVVETGALLFSDNSWTLHTYPDVLNECTIVQGPYETVENAILLLKLDCEVFLLADKCPVGFSIIPDAIVAMRNPVTDRVANKKVYRYTHRGKFTTRKVVLPHMEGATVVLRCASAQCRAWTEWVSLENPKDRLLKIGRHWIRASVQLLGAQLFMVLSAEQSAPYRVENRAINPIIITPLSGPRVLVPSRQWYAIESAQALVAVCGRDSADLLVDVDDVGRCDMLDLEHDEKVQGDTVPLTEEGYALLCAKRARDDAHMERFVRRLFVPLRVKSAEQAELKHIIPWYNGRKGSPQTLRKLIAELASADWVVRKPYVEGAGYKIENIDWIVQKINTCARMWECKICPDAMPLWTFCAELALQPPEHDEDFHARLAQSSAIDMPLEESDFNALSAIGRHAFIHRFCWFHSLTIDKQSVTCFSDLECVLREKQRGEDETANPSSVALNEQGYQAVARMKNSELMATFIRRVTAQQGLEILDFSRFVAFVPNYSGEQQTQSYERLTTELLTVPWIKAKEYVNDKLIRTEVCMDGGTKVLRVGQEKRESPKDAIAVDCVFAGVHIAYLWDTTYEVALTTDWIEIQKTELQRSFTLKVHHVQVDNLCPNAKFPIILTPVDSGFRSDWRENQKEAVSFFVCRVGILPSLTTTHVPEFQCIIQPMQVKIDAGFLVAFGSHLSSTFSFTGTKGVPEAELRTARETAIKVPMSDVGVKLLFLEVFRFGALIIHLECVLPPSLLDTDDQDDDSDTFLEQLQGIRHPSGIFRIALAPIQFVAYTIGSMGKVALLNFAHISPTFCFQELIIEQFYGEPTPFAQKVMYHFAKDGMKQIYKVIGSVNLLGDPVGFLDGAGKSVVTFFRKTGSELIGESELKGEGLKVLVQGVVGGFFVGVAKFAKSGGDILATRGTHQRPSRHIDHLGDGIVAGAEEFGLDVLEGVTGLFNKPMSGARQSGVTGFVRGLGQGVAGVAGGVVGGLLHVAENVASGVNATTHLMDTQRWEGCRRPTRAKDPDSPRSSGAGSPRSAANISHATSGFGGANSPLRGAAGWRPPISVATGSGLLFPAAVSTASLPKMFKINRVAWGALWPQHSVKLDRWFSPAESGTNWKVQLMTKTDEGEWKNFALECWIRAKSWTEVCLRVAAFSRNVEQCSALVCLEHLVFAYEEEARWWKEAYCIPGGIWLPLVSRGHIMCWVLLSVRPYQDPVTLPLNVTSMVPECELQMTPPESERPAVKLALMTAEPRSPTVDHRTSSSSLRADEPAAPRTSVQAEVIPAKAPKRARDQAFNSSELAEAYDGIAQRKSTYFGALVWSTRMIELRTGTLMYWRGTKKTAHPQKTYYLRDYHVSLEGNDVVVLKQNGRPDSYWKPKEISAAEFLQLLRNHGAS